MKIKLQQLLRNVLYGKPIEGDPIDYGTFERVRIKSSVFPPNWCRFYVMSFGEYN